MRTLYGIEAKDGDYVLVQDVGYLSGTADILIAKVVGNKAYTSKATNHKGGLRWIRKETAIIKIDPKEVPNATAALIDMNINSKKSTFSRDTDEKYTDTVWQLFDAERREQHSTAQR